MNPLPIDCELDIMSGFKTPQDVEIRSIEFRLNGVVAVDWKIMDDTSATDSAQRHSLDVLILRKILPEAVGFTARTDTRISNCQSPDLHRGGDISFLKQ